MRFSRYDEVSSTVLKFVRFFFTEARSLLKSFRTLKTIHERITHKASESSNPVLLKPLFAAFAVRRSVAPSFPFSSFQLSLSFADRPRMLASVLFQLLHVSLERR